MIDLESLTLESLSAYTDKELADLKQALENEHITLNSEQNALKLLGNACFGMQGSPQSMWFKREIAEAITLSGQYTILNVSAAIHDVLSRAVDYKGRDSVIYNDTDSSFVNLSPLVEKFCKDKTPDDKHLFVDRVCAAKLAPVISKTLEDQARAMNAYENLLAVKRENIADKAIIIASKNYILNVVNKEGGIKLDKPKLKLTGISAVRTSTPPDCRKVIPKMIESVFKFDEATVIKMIDEYRSRFKTLSLKEIGKPSGVNNVDEYYVKETREFKKRIPIAVRASMNFNHFIQDHNLADRYTPILEGDKVSIVYLKMPNPLRQDVIGFKEEPPHDLDLLRYIDWEKQFTVCFLRPMEIILNPIGWKTEAYTTLDDLFG